MIERAIFKRRKIELQWFQCSHSIEKYYQTMRQYAIFSNLKLFSSLRSFLIYTLAWRTSANIFLKANLSLQKIESSTWQPLTIFLALLRWRWWWFFFWLQLMSSINIVYIFIPNAFSPRLGGIKRKKLIFHPSTSMWFHFFISPSLRANLEFCVLILVVQLKNIPCYCIDVDKMSTTPSGDSALLLSTGHRYLRELSLHVWWVERLAFKSVLRSQFVELLLFPFFFPI